MARAPKSDAPIDRLYQLPPGEFVAARNALAKETGAADIKALQKPSLPAWAVNQLYWRSRDLYDEVTARAEDLKATHLATERGKRADLRGASRDHEQAVDAALKATLSLLAEDGQPITDATRQAIATTLRGLPGEEPPGRLTRPLEPRGFDMLAAAAAGAGRVKAAAPAAKAPVVALPAGKADGKPAGKADRKKEAEERAAERERLAAAREALVAATRATRIAEQAARREEFEAARAARDAEKAQQRVKDAGAAVEEAQEALAAAEREAADAAKARDAANERVKRARAELTEMQEGEEKARRAGSPTAD
jgi:hypothetical protein